MSEIHWLNPVSDSFTNASDWSGGTVPGAGDDAILDAPGGSPYTVTASTSETVNSIQTASDATLAITGGTFTAGQGTGLGANGGTLFIGDESIFVAAGVLTNTGTISLGDGSASAAALEVDGNTTLSGGGQIVMSNSKHNQIGATTKHGVILLTNLDNTISGAGTIGNQIDGIINEINGVIDANSKAALNISTVVTNYGVLEATGGGKLSIDLFGVGNYGAVILAGNESVVGLYNTYVEGGTLESAGSGKIVAGNAFLTNITNESHLSVSAYLELHGVIRNLGEISLGSTGGIEINSSASLNGNGAIFMGADDSIRNVDLGATLTNVDNTISGSGFIGDGLTLVNDAQGVIDASDSTLLTIDTAHNVITNAGTIEVMGSGGANIESTITNSGLLSAVGGTLTVGVRTGKIDNTGTLSVGIGGTVIVNDKVSGAGVAIIGGGELDFTSSFNEAVTFTATSGVLQLAESQDYTKAITGFSRTGGTSLDLGDIGFVSSTEATFSGTKKGGTLTVTDGTHTATISLKGNYLKSVFVASSDGNGGVIVVAEKAEGVSAPPHSFIAAMAALGGSGGATIHVGQERAVREPVLLSPRTMMA